MKKVIAVAGTEDRGKSGTLWLVHNKLLKKYPDAISFRPFPRVTKDVCIILTIKGVKIGLEGRGDPSDRLPFTLKRFVQEKCQIIICTCRTGGRTRKAVEALEQDGYGKPLWMYHDDNCETLEAQEARNEATARQIITEVEKAFH